MDYSIFSSLKPLIYTTLIIIYFYIVKVSRQNQTLVRLDVCIALIGFLLMRLDFVSYKLAIVFLFLSLSFRNFSGKLSAFFFSLLQTIFLSVSLYEAAYYYTTQKWIGNDAIFAIYQTHLSEAKSYLISHPTYLIIAIITFFLLIIFYKLNRKLYVEPLYSSSSVYTCKKYTIKKTYLFIILAILSCLLGRHVVRHSEAYQAYKTTKNFFRQIEEKTSPQDLTATVKEKMNIVIIIGESANRDYHSCYGFPYPTTPWLDSQKSNPNFLFFQNAYTCNKFTGKALLMALSEQNQYNNLPISKAADLIDVLHKTGYIVYWISNQGMTNNVAEGFQYMTVKSDFFKFTKQNGSLYDETLTDYVPVTNDKGHAIIIHLMGSHGTYMDRSPQEYKKFHFPNIKEHGNSVNEYCNSILYTDHILKDLFYVVNKNIRPDFIIYFSDHGEKPGVGRDRFEWAMTRIPLIIWTSDKYITKHPNKIANMKAHLTQGFSNDMMYDTVLGLLSINTNHRSEKYDLSSSYYSFSMENLLTEYGKHKVRDDCYIKGNISFW